MSAWTTLAELRPGAIFETRDGVRAVKSEYRYGHGGIECVLLASGEAAHFDQPGHDPRKHNATEVREIDFEVAIAAERERIATLLRTKAAIVREEEFFGPREGAEVLRGLADTIQRGEAQDG